MLSFLDYSITKPYLDKNGQQCILTHFAESCWENFTRENFEPRCREDVRAWNEIYHKHTQSFGITYATGKGAGRQSTIDPTTPGFFEQLEALIKRYDPSDIDALEKLKR